MDLCFLGNGFLLNFLKENKKNIYKEWIKYLKDNEIEVLQLHGEIGNKENPPIVKFKSNPDIKITEWDNLIKNENIDNVCFFGISIEGDEHLFLKLKYSITAEIYYFHYVIFEWLSSEYIYELLESNIFDILNVFDLSDCYKISYLNNNKLVEFSNEKSLFKGINFKNNISKFRLHFDTGNIVYFNIILFSLDKKQNFSSINKIFNENNYGEIEEDIQWEKKPNIKK